MTIEEKLHQIYNGRDSISEHELFRRGLDWTEIGIYQLERLKDIIRKTKVYEFRKRFWTNRKFKEVTNKIDGMHLLLSIGMRK